MHQEYNRKENIDERDNSFNTAAHYTIYVFPVLLPTVLRLLRLNNETDTKVSSTTAVGILSN